MSNPFEYGIPDPGSGNRRGCLIGAVIFFVILAIAGGYMMSRPPVRAIPAPRITDPAPAGSPTTQSNR